MEILNYSKRSLKPSLSMKKKNHYQLADDLQRIINSVPMKQVKTVESNFQQNYLHLLPKDKDSNFPLVDIKSSKFLLEDLVLNKHIKIQLKN